MKKIIFRLLVAGLLQADIVAGREGEGHTPFAIGARRELPVDGFWIEKLSGGARRELNHPARRNVALDHNVPWEGNTCAFHAVFRDGNIYRMYYRASHQQKFADKLQVIHPFFICYAESRDGIHWARPNLGLVEFNGSTENNIILTNHCSHGFSVFKDLNPACAPAARYKAVTRGSFRYQSPDGIRWALMSPDRTVPAIDGDSQTVVFWDAVRARYVSFARAGIGAVRWIKTSVSPDFLRWSAPENIKCPEAPLKHLYTNQTVPYHRAPHIFMAFPMRFSPRRWAAGFYGGISDGGYMTSRDGEVFQLWDEAFIRPGPQRSTWLNRNNLIACGVVETPSDLPGAPAELSLYATEGYYEGDGVRLRRYSLRLDGFVSIRAPQSGGEMLTRPLLFNAPAVMAPAAGFTVDENTPAFVNDSRPLAGRASLSVSRAIGQGTVLNLTGARQLGSNVTLAARVRPLPSESGYMRLFSAYAPAAPSRERTRPEFIGPARENAHDQGLTAAGSGELTFSVSFGRGSAPFITFSYDGNHVVVRPKDPGMIGGFDVWDALNRPGGGDERGNHFAVTWQDGVIDLYFDGRQVASGGKPGAGAITLARGDLRFGQDYNQPETAFTGEADDIAVLKRALAPHEIAVLAGAGAASLLDPDIEEGVLFNMENDPVNRITDGLPRDGSSDISLARETGAVQLLINYATSVFGGLRVEIQDAAGMPLPGFRLDECDLIYGDRIERAVTWAGRSELQDLAGRPVRLRFEIKDADLYSLRFGRK